MAMTTLSRMMKKSASEVFPLASRRTRSYGNYTSAIRTTPSKTSTTSIRCIGTSSSTNLSSHLSRAASVSTHHPTSAPAKKESNSDDILLRNIQSEIDQFQIPAAPREFPFKIEDDEEERENIILTREYQDKQIKVNVRARDSYSRCVELVVSVTKKDGSTLEFDVTADETDGHTIKSWVIKNPNASDDDGPDFSNLDDVLQDDFYTYLEDRGIEPSITTFLCDYMDVKEKKYDNDYLEEKLLWWKKLKTFIEN